MILVLGNKLSTNLSKVGPNSLLLALTGDCGRLQEDTLRTCSVVCVVLSHDLKDTSQKNIITLSFCTSSRIGSRRSNTPSVTFLSKV